MTKPRNNTVSRFPVRETTELRNRVQTTLMDNMDDPVLIGFLEALYDEESKTGRVRFDDYKAAERIQELARDVPVIAEAKTAIVMKSLVAVLRRLGLTRKQRIETFLIEADQIARSANNRV